MVGRNCTYQREAYSLQSKVSHLAFQNISYIFSIACSVANRLEKLQKDFLWGGKGDNFNFHLVNWSICCNPLLYTMENWGLRRYCCVIKLCCESGFGDMQRKCIMEESNRRMALSVQITVRARSRDCTCWVCGIKLEEGMPCILSYMTVMALKFVGWWVH